MHPYPVPYRHVGLTVTARHRVTVDRISPIPKLNSNKKRRILRNMELSESRKKLQFWKIFDIPGNSRQGP